MSELGAYPFLVWCDLLLALRHLRLLFLRVCDVGARAISLYSPPARDPKTLNKSNSEQDNMNQTRAYVRNY